MDLSTKYLGLELSSPIIAGSSGLTNSVKDIKEIEEHGAGAVVLKSLFEEEIEHELQKSQQEMNRPGTLYPEIFDFFDFDTMEDSVSNYLFLIENLKKEVKIPIIASVNCVSSSEWTGFAKRLERAGADALELNFSIAPSDFTQRGEDNERILFDVISKVKKEVSIPVAVKLSYYFSNLGLTLQKLSKTEVDGIVMFNRYFSPDFDIENMKVIPASIYSSPEDLTISLRWMAIMAQRVQCDLAASTGVHDGAGLIKQILAGANAVQVTSTLYKNGLHRISKMNNELSEWMEKKGFKSLDDFRGKMSQAQSDNPAAIERVQFMKHFSKKNI